jgi:hypothetical protein
MSLSRNCGILDLKDDVRSDGMQILVVFRKSDRKLIATFELQTIITDMNVLKIPEVDYLVTTKKDVFYADPNGEYYVKEN